MRFLPALAVPLVALSFAGCATAPTDSTPQNAAVEQAPAFETDEEALAAAQAAYAEYLAVSDQIAREGGANPERLETYVTQDQYLKETKSFETYVSKGLHSEGEMSFDTLHKAGESLDGYSFYLCLDSSQSRVVDSSGNDVTPSGRVDRWPMYVTFSTNEQSLVISGSETWSGLNFC